MLIIFVIVIFIVYFSQEPGAELFYSVSSTVLSKIAWTPAGSVALAVQCISYWVCKSRAMCSWGCCVCVDLLPPLLLSSPSFPFLIKTCLFGTGELTQWVKFLPCKHGPEFGSRCPPKKLCKAVCTCSPAAWVGRKGKMLQPVVS